jgi:hypothetical protein
VRAAVNRMNRLEKRMLHHKILILRAKIGL